jgi:hypothetical protein
MKINIILFSFQAQEHRLAAALATSPSARPTCSCSATRSLTLPRSFPPSTSGVRRSEPFLPMLPSSWLGVSPTSVAIVTSFPGWPNPVARQSLPTKLCRSVDKSRRSFTSKRARRRRRDRPSRPSRWQGWPRWERSRRSTRCCPPGSRRRRLPKPPLKSSDFQDRPEALWIVRAKTTRLKRRNSSGKVFSTRTSNGGPIPRLDWQKRLRQRFRSLPELRI